MAAAVIMQDVLSDSFEGNDLDGPPNDLRVD